MRRPRHQRRTPHLRRAHQLHPLQLLHPMRLTSGDRHKSSPLVRKIAKEHNVDIGRIQGSGIGGRVTKQDILGFIDKGPESFDSRSARTAGGSLAQDGVRSVRPRGRR